VTFLFPGTYQSSEDNGEEAEEGDDVLVGGNGIKVSFFVTDAEAK